MNEWFDEQKGNSQTPVGPRLKASLFVPYGLGIVFEDDQGGLWKTRIIKAGDGLSASVFLDPVEF